MKAARGTLASQAAIGGMLSRAWEKLKSIGRAVFAPLIPYLQKGFAWAKGMAQQGLAWFNRTPWAKMILPLLLITGGVMAARKLINKVRKRKMSPEEEVALKSYAMKNNTKINELRKKANLKPIKITESREDQWKNPKSFNGECEGCGKKGKVYNWNDSKDYDVVLCKKCLEKDKKEKRYDESNFYT
jgi:hypothetical protein